MAGQIAASAQSSKCRAKFNRSQYFHSPEIKLLLAEFLSLFHPYGYIYKSACGSWQSAPDPRWKLSASEICKAISCLHYNFIGTRWDKETRHAVIDIDSSSQYHNKAGLKRLLAVLEAAGLPNAVPYQSSDSGGWHVYIFFAEPVSSRKIRDYLRKLLVLKGFTIKQGTMEIFPDPGYFGVLGQGLRLPLQPGWAWLNANTLEVIEERLGLSPASALSRFMSDLEDNQHTCEEYRNFCYYVEHLSKVTSDQAAISKAKVMPIAAARCSSGSQEDLAQIIEVFGHVPINIIAERWLAGRQIAQTGLTEQSQRHFAELALGHYYFYGDPSLSIAPLGYGYEDEREAVITQVLTTKHNGLSKEIIQGRAEAFADISRAVNWVPAHRRGQTEVAVVAKTNAGLKIRNKLANIKRANNARKKIQEALATMLEQGLPIMVNELQREAGVSKQTLYKHQDIWRKQYLANGTGENSVGMGGVLQETHAHLPLNIVEKPPQLLAARQIVSEIVARSKRERLRKQKQERKQQEQSLDDWLLRTKSQLDELPADYNELDTASLKTKIAVLNHLLAISPTYDDQEWLRGSLTKLIQEHRQRIENSLPLPVSDSS